LLFKKNCVGKHR